jgi:hypothetical protein
VNAGQVDAAAERCTSKSYNAIPDRNVRQPSTAIERRLSNGSNRPRNIDTCQAGGLERKSLDVCNGGRDGQIGKRLARIEGAMSDSGDAVWNCYAARLAFGPLQQRRLIFVEQDSIHAAIELIIRVDDYLSHAAAKQEGIVSKVGDATVNENVRQTGADPKRIPADTGNALRNCHLGKALTTVEGDIANANDAVRKRHTTQTFANKERVVRDTGDRAG